MAGPEQFGQRFNAWAILRSLIDNHVGILVSDGAPTNGTSGSYAGKAGPGTMVVDINTGVWYVNIGTIDSPVYSSMGGPVASGIAGGSVGGGLGTVGNAKFTYSFAASGGAIGTITPANSPTIPAGAIILGGIIDVTTLVTSAAANTGTIALGLGSGAQAAALLAAAVVSGAPFSTTGLKAIIPVWTAATAVKVAAATPLTMTVALQALTAGVFDVNVVYVQGNV